MTQVLFCPFCRESHDAADAAGVCPEHGLRLVPFQRLPPAPPVAGSDERVNAWDLRFGRGIVLLGAALNAVAFFLPLAELEGAVNASSTLLELATGRAKTLWLVPLVACAQVAMLLRARRRSRLLAIRLAVLWVGVLPGAVVGLTLLGAFDAVDVMNGQRAHPSRLVVGLGAWLVAVATVPSLLGALRLGRQARRAPVAVETVE